MVHKGAKWTMGIGGTILVLAIIFMAFGFAGIIESEPEDYWSGTASTSTEIELSEMSIYPIFVENTSTTVSLSPSTNDNRFIPCTEDDSCGYYSESGMAHIGELKVVDAGNYTVTFTGNGAVKIQEVEFETEDLLAMGAGGIGCCIGFIVLLIGIILAFTLKEKGAQSNVVMVDPATGQLVSHQQPVYSGGAVVVQQQSVVADPAMVHYNELLSQGYDPSKAESYARMRYPEFKGP